MFSPCLDSCIHDHNCYIYQSISTLSQKNISFVFDFALQKGKLTQYFKHTDEHFIQIFGLICKTQDKQRKER